MIYTSDAIKCTVVRAEGLPVAARKKPCIIEVGFGGSIQCTRKQKPDIESGAASYAALDISTFLACACVDTQTADLLV